MRLLPGARLLACVAGISASTVGCGDARLPRLEPVPVRPTWVQSRARVGDGPYSLAQAGHHGLDAEETPGRPTRWLVPWTIESREYRRSTAVVREQIANQRAPSVAVFVERSISWDHVASLLTAVRGATTPDPVVAFMLANRAFPTSYRPERLDATFTTVDGDAGLRVEARRPASDGRSRTTVVVAGEAFDFPPGDRFDDEEWLAPANARWDAIRESIVLSRGSPGASMAVDDAVPWAYVAVLLSFLHEAGLSAVRIEGTDFGLRLSSPPPFTPVDATGHDPRDWPVPVALAVGFAAALVVTALGARRARPRRPPSAPT